MLEYHALFEPEPDGSGVLVVTFPAFGWGVSQGDNEKEALEMAEALLQTLIQELIRQSKPLPEPGKARGRKYRTIRLSALQTAKAELYREFLASGIRKSELSRRLGIPKANVDRLFDLGHHSRLDQLEAAFQAFGKQLRIEFRMRPEGLLVDPALPLNNSSFPTLPFPPRRPSPRGWQRTPGAHLSSQSFGPSRELLNCCASRQSAGFLEVYYCE